jgi:hypothetical protein
MPAINRSGGAAAIRCVKTLENPIKTMITRGFVVAAGLQFLAGVKEYS